MLIQKLMFVAKPASAVVLYLLLALSVISIGVIIERWWFFSRRRVNVIELGESIERALRTGGDAAALGVLAESRSVEARILTDAIKWRARGAESVEQILAKSVRQHRPEVEVGLLFLGTLGNNAPFIGLFGTVLGVIHATQDLSNTAGRAGAHVMSGISEALISTAVGLLVALPAVVAYNYFQRMLKTRSAAAESIGGELIAHLKSPAQPSRKAA